METCTARENGDNGTAYINGHVYTINPQQPWVDAFVVSPTGIITAVGSNEEIRARAKQEGLICFNLDGLFIMPGITTLTFAYVNEDWVVARGFTVENFERQILDKHYPNTPVVIRGGAEHIAFLNSAALKRSGYDIENEPVEQGAYYVLDHNGHLTGEMAENGLSKVMTSIPQPGLQHITRVLAAAQRRLHTAGVTSCQEASSNTLLLRGLQAMEVTNELKLEIFPHIVHAPDWIAEEKQESLHELLDNAESFRSKHVDTRFVKIILDGVPLNPYYTHAPLEHEDGSVDESKLLVLDIAEAVKKYDERGMTMKIHCTGTGATRTALDAYAAARESNPDGPRHEIAHCSGVHDDDYWRFYELGVTAEMSPALLFDCPKAASEGVIEHNFTKMLAAGAHMTIGSDWGPTTEPHLLPCLANTAAILGNGDRRAGGEALCRMLTLGGAEAVGREKDLGSIEVGKKANFIAVDRDLSEGCFTDATVLATWFEGEVVFSV